MIQWYLFGMLITMGFVVHANASKGESSPVLELVIVGVLWPLMWAIFWHYSKPPK